MTHVVYVVYVVCSYVRTKVACTEVCTNYESTKVLPEVIIRKYFRNSSVLPYGSSCTFVRKYLRTKVLSKVLPYSTLYFRKYFRTSVSLPYTYVYNYNVHVR